MHGCCLILTKEFPTDEVLQQVLEPYYEYSVTAEKPIFKWDWWTVGGRYKGKFKLRAEQYDEKVKNAISDPNVADAYACIVDFHW